VAETANERIRIEASPQRCYEVATDFEHYPKWAKDVKQAKVLERDDEGRGHKVEYRAAAMGRSIRYVLDYDYGEAPGAFSWKLVEGDMLRRLDGRYAFQPDDDATRVTYELVVDLSVPMPGLIKRRAAGLIMGSALKELKREVERA
jgi:ribosome-associated toxin RatA of RatAB toxin-antitoxin module